MEHVYQDVEEKEDDAHRVDKDKGHDKHRSRRPKLSFEELLAKYEKQISPIGQRKSNHQNYLQNASLKSRIGKEIHRMQ